MYPFFETIRFCNGVLENLHYHQHRVDRTFMQMGMEDILSLSSIDIKNTVSFPLYYLRDQVYKCKIQYNLNGEYTVELSPYVIRAIHSIEMVEIVNKQYKHKYTNRDWINQLHASAYADEIIIVENGIVKDASYANLCFFDGENWYTPQEPLLLGTRRAFLLDTGVIKEREIKVQDLHLYHSVRLINAMMLWSESITLRLNK